MLQSIAGRWESADPDRGTPKNTSGRADGSLTVVPSFAVAPESAIQEWSLA
jgi:hypothetical protein